MLTRLSMASQNYVKANAKMLHLSSYYFFFSEIVLPTRYSSVSDIHGDQTNNLYALVRPEFFY